MYKLIIFDLDGTLLDSVEDLANSVNHALQIFNYPTHPTTSYKHFVGNGVNKLLERALPVNCRTNDHISMIKHEFLKHYNIHSEDSTKPYDGIVNLLNELQSQNFKIAIASNKYHDGTIKLSKKFFPTIQFENILGQREGIPTKPSPDILFEIIDKAKLSKNEVLYVGDSGVDAATALNAGIDFVGVLWGFRSQSELEQAGASSFAYNTQDLYMKIYKMNTI